MGYDLTLPKDLEQRESVLNKMIEEGEKARHPREVNWWHTHHYLQGARDFTNVNYELGTLDVNYINQDGLLRFRFDDVVSKYQSQLGRLMRVDLRANVQKKSVGLDGLRNAAIAQIILDSAMPATKVEAIKLKAIPPLLKYGCIGLQVWNQDEEIGIDVIMPWELVPIPAKPMEDKDVRGLARVRYVPLEWVKKLEKTPGAKDKRYEEMERITIPVGNMPSESGDRFSIYGESIATGDVSPHKPFFGSGTKKLDKTNVDLVKLVEVWTETSTGYLGCYELMAGGKLLHTRDYAPDRITMPISKVNDIRTGDFWGRSFVSTQIPMNTEMEYSLGRMFQTIQDLDAYGILCIPTSLGIPPQITVAQDGTRRLFFDPDYVNQDLRPFNMGPANMGTFPANILKIAVGISDKMANQPDELMRGKAPGRVDSGSGLGFLLETSNTPLTPTAAGLAAGMTNCYSSILDIVGAGAWDQDKLVQIAMLDDTLAGVKFDPTSGAMVLGDNPIPRPEEVAIFVRSMEPRSPEREKMELMEALDRGSIDMFEYRIQVRKKGLDLPVGNEAEWQNYRRAVLENIILFGDGNEPGEIIVDDLDMHDVHLRVLQPFRSRPEFYAASPQVREAINKHYEFHITMMAASMPDQAPYPEDAAVEQEAQSRMMENEIL